MIRVDNGFERTAKDWSYDHERFASITEQRWDELAQIQEFVETDACLTKFIDDVLDGNLDSSCGQCANCTEDFLPSVVRNDDLVQAAVEHYRAESWDDISARYFMPERDGGKSKIAESRKPNDGRLLSVYGDPGLGKLVREQKNSDDRYSDQLVDAAVEHIQNDWNPDPEPMWVTAVPPYSGRDPVDHIDSRVISPDGGESD